MKTFITILITAIIVGGGVYFWQNQSSTEVSSTEIDNTSVEEEEVDSSDIIVDDNQETYSDSDLEFTYPTSYWKVVRNASYIEVYPEEPSPIDESGVGLVSLAIYNDPVDFEETNAELEFNSNSSKNICIPKLELKLANYDICEYEQVHTGIEGISTIYSLTPSNEDQPGIIVYDRSQAGFFVENILTVLNVK